MNAQELEMIAEELENQYGMGMKMGEAQKLINVALEQIEPQLLFARPGEMIDWHRKRHLVESRLDGTNASSLARALKDLAEVTRKYARGPGAPGRQLPPLRDVGLARVVEDEWQRLRRAAHTEDGKSATIAAATVIEGILLDIAQRAPDAAALRGSMNAVRGDVPEAHGAPERWSLIHYVHMASPKVLSILSVRVVTIANGLRDARNLVHPAKAREERLFTPSDGRLALATAETVLEEIDIWEAAGGVLKLP